MIMTSRVFGVQFAAQLCFMLFNFLDLHVMSGIP